MLPKFKKIIRSPGGKYADGCIALAEDGTVWQYGTWVFGAEPKVQRVRAWRELSEVINVEDCQR